MFLFGRSRAAALLLPVVAYASTNLSTEEGGGQVNKNKKIKKMHKKGLFYAEKVILSSENDILGFGHRGLGFTIRKWTKCCPFRF